MSDLNQLITKAYELFESKNYADAIIEICGAEETLKNNKSIPEVSDYEKEMMFVSLQNLKGFNYLGLNDLDKAKDCFEQSLKQNPESSQACAGLGEIYYLANCDQEAKIMFEWAIDNNPFNIFAIAGLAKANRSLGLPDDHDSLKIETTLNKKETFFKSLASAYDLFTSKRNKESLQKLVEIEKLFSKAVLSNDTNKKLSSIENFKGFNFLAMQDFENARQCFEKALRLNPNSSQASAGLAEIFHLREMEKEAKKMYEWAVKNNPENRFAVTGLAKVNKVLQYNETHNSLMH